MKITKIGLGLVMLNTTFGVAHNIMRVEAAPMMATMAKIPVGESYKTYALAQDTASLDGAEFDEEREKLGFPMSIIATGDKRAQETKNGYATVFATGAQTTLRVPLGWFAFETVDNLDESIVRSPDKTVRVVARMPLDSATFQTERTAFVDLKKTVVEQTKQRLKAQNLTAKNVVVTEISDDDFTVRADEVKDANGKDWSYFELFSQRATPAERDEWWAKYDRGEALNSLPAPLAMSLLAPKAAFEKNLGLLGLMVRDEGVNWAREEQLTPEEFAARVPDAAKILQLADEAVALLKAGDIKAFQARFPEADADVVPAAKQKYQQDLSKVLQMLPAKPERSSIKLLSDSDPVAPLFRVSLARDFLLDKTPIYYVVAIERAEKSDKLLLLGVATASLEELEYAQQHPME